MQRSDNLGQKNKSLADSWTMEPNNDLPRDQKPQSYTSLLPTYDANATLCSECATSEVWRADFKASRDLNMLSTNSSHCRFCRLLYATATKLQLKEPCQVHCRREKLTLQVSGRHSQSANLVIFLQASKAQSTTQADRQYVTALLDSVQLGTPSLPPAGTEKQYDILRHWLDVCDNQHYHSRDDDQRTGRCEMPSRLIELDGERLRLITCSSRHLDYIAFSHRWGNSPHFRTLDNNVNDHFKDIPFDQLPRSFQDAVKVTRALRIRYLWIDSLCIIQENEDDWNRELSRMGQVFSNAYCTIAASSAESSDEGFLDRTHHPVQFATVPGPAGAKLHISECIEDFHRDVEKATLNTRGWVLQERALSYRTLHFTKTQVYWECGNGIQSERQIKLSK